MCLFSGEVSHVSSTNIFARDVGGGRQVLAYEMVVSMTDAVAMVLPLPVPPGPGDDAVRFIDLSGCRGLFAQLKSAFPEPLPRNAATFGLVQSGYVAPPLVVHEVGDYEASFVPTMADFDRLDARFCMSDDVWSALPGYADYGFAVFKLSRRDEWRPAHPMAFEFPRRDAQLFFPTVHVHAGVVHAQAEFDHALYAQTGAGDPLGWRRSEKPARDIVQWCDHAGVLDLAQHVYQRKIVGSFDNADVRL